MFVLRSLWFQWHSDKSSLCRWNDGVAWRCSREACKGWVLENRYGASGLMVETHCDFGLGTTDPRLLAPPGPFKAQAQQWKSGYWMVLWHDLNLVVLLPQMISRIEYVHTKNFIHRDIKPDNFLMGIGRHCNKVNFHHFFFLCERKSRFERFKCHGGLTWE